jgi:hypothetical protein
MNGSLLDEVPTHVSIHSVKSASVVQFAVLNVCMHNQI